MVHAAQADYTKKTRKEYKILMFTEDTCNCTAFGKSDIQYKLQSHTTMRFSCLPANVLDTATD